MTTFAPPWINSIDAFGGIEMSFARYTIDAVVPPAATSIHTLTLTADDVIFVNRIPMSASSLFEVTSVVADVDICEE